MSEYTENPFARRTAVVTGGGSGIGRATVIRLVREGVRVVTSDISEERMDALRDELASPPPRAAGWRTARCSWRR